MTAPISLSFDADKHDGNTSQALPGTFSVEVPAGEGRLIQVLAIYMDPTTKDGEFFYGSMLKDLVGGDQPVDIYMDSIGIGNVKGGRVSGKYFAADGSNPSGMMEIRYQPPGDRPPMVLERSSMVGGWFHAFALADVSFDFALGPNIILPAVTLKSFSLNSNKLVKAHLPNRYQTYGGGSGGELRSSEEAIIGFFGPGVPETHKICLVQDSYTYTKLFQPNQTTPLGMSIGADNGLDVRIQTAGTVTTCTSTDLSAAYLSVLPVSPGLIDNWGGLEALTGFYGIFTFPTLAIAGSSPVQTAFNGPSANFSSQFSILPGLNTVGTNSSVDSIGLFFRASNQPRDYERGEAPCFSISQGGLGFQPLGQIPITPGTLSYSSTLPAPSTMTSTSVIAYCPLKNGMPVGGGYVSSWLSTMGGGGGGGSGAPAAFHVTKNSSPINFSQITTCIDVSVRLKDSSGYQTMSGTAFTFILSLTGGGVLFNTFNDCQTVTNAIGNGTPLSFPASQGQTNYWVRTPSSAGAIDIMASASGMTSSTVSLSVLSGGNYYARLELPESMLSGLCYSGRVIYYDIWGNPQMAGSPLTVNLTAPAGFAFFSDASCSTVISSTTINTSTFSTPLWTKLTSAGVGGFGQFQPETSGPGLLQAIFRRYSGSGSAVPTQLTMMGQTAPYKGNCAGPYFWEAKNANFTTVPVGSATNVTLSGTGSAQFFSDSSCATGTALIGVAATNYSGAFWAKFNSAGVGSVTATMPGLSPRTVNVDVYGVHKFNLSPGVTTPAHGECVAITVNPVEFPSASTVAFPYSEEITLNLTGFPAGSLFRTKVGNECMGSLSGNTLVKPALSSPSMIFYYLAKNLTAASTATI